MSNPNFADSGLSADDPNVQALLDALAKGGDGNVLLQSLVGSSMPPAASLIAGLLMREASGGESADFVPDDDADEIERLLAFAEGEPFADEGATDGEDDELETLREVNDTVAAALGACPQCWGGSPDCEICKGEGGAGAMDPDERLFSELILPAIRRVSANRRSRQSAARTTERSTSQETDNGRT